MIAVELNPSDYVRSLEKLLEDFCELVRAAGASVSPYTPESMGRFAAYRRETQQQIYDGFIKYVSTVLDIVEGGISLENTEQSLWRIIKKHQLRPRPDLFSSICRDDFITVYLPNHVQWYRSFNYFRISSYSLGELICIPWHELYEHQNAHMSFFLETTEAIFSGQIRESVFPDLGPTVSRELFSSRRFTASLDPRILSPLTGLSGANEAIVTSWKIHILDGIAPESGKEQKASPLNLVQSMTTAMEKKP